MKKTHKKSQNQNQKNRKSKRVFFVYSDYLVITYIVYYASTKHLKNK